MLSLAKKNPDFFYNKYKDAAIDAPAFFRLYEYCDLAKCQGFCCFGGVEVSAPERAEIEKLVAGNPKFFKDKGVDTENLFTASNGNEAEISTQTREFRYSVPIPAHFEHTSCNFRDSAGRCTLQIYGAEHGKDSWSYKPFFCWLFPISILPKNGVEIITVCSDENDVCEKEPDFPGFTEYTGCGRKAMRGRPAHQVLSREIAALSKLLRRDLLKEILEYKGI